MPVRGSKRAKRRKVGKAHVHGIMVPAAVLRPAAALFNLVLGPSYRHLLPGSKQPKKTVQLRTRPGRLVMDAKDAGMRLTAAISISCGGRMEGGVPANLLKAAADAYAGSDVVLSRSGSRIRFSPTAADIESRIELNAEPAGKTGTETPRRKKLFECPAPELAEKLRQGGYAAMPDAANLQGMAGAVLLEHLPGLSCRIVSTDGHRLAFCGPDLPSPKQTVIPKTAARVLAGMLAIAGGDARVTLSETGGGAAVFKTGGFVLTVDKTVSAYLNYRKAIPAAKAVAKTSTKELLHAVELVAAACRTRQHAAMTLAFGKNSLTVEGAFADGEEFSSDVRTEYRGPTLSVALNPRYVAQALNAAGTETVDLVIPDVEDPRYGGFGVNAADPRNPDAARSLIMPLRL